MIDLSILEGPYLADILNQPQALRETWKALEASTAWTKIEEIRQQGGWRRILLTGMGSSFFGLQPLCLELTEAGLDARMMETSELIYYATPLLTPETLVVAVSQSGESAETLRLLDLNAGRARVIGVTNTEGSSLAKRADAAVVTAAGKEFSVSCKTYLASLMALDVLGASLTGADRAQRLQQLTAIADAVESYLAGWRGHVEQLSAALAGAHSLFFVGRGASLAAAGVGALTTKESTHFHAEAMSSASFRHGPFEMLSSDVAVVVFAGDERTRVLNEKIYTDIAAQGARALLVGQESGNSSCRIAVLPESLRPILEMLPAQMITLALAALARREPGRFERASKVTTVE